MSPKQPNSKRKRESRPGNESAQRRRRRAERAPTSKETEPPSRQRGREPEKPRRGPLARLAAAPLALAGELVAIAREMLAIPASLYMRVAELAGRVVLWVWRLVWPPIRAVLRLIRRLVRAGERRLTPLRGAALAAVAAAIALGASQFADYTATGIATDQYAEIGAVAPPPQVSSATTGSAHAWVGIPIALAALVAIWAAARGRRRAPAVLALLGLATIAISLLIDRPQGLDEGEAAIVYEGARATLQGGFWAQLTAGVVLVALAPLIGAYARRGAAPARPQRKRRAPAERRPRPRRPAEPVPEG